MNETGETVNDLQRDCFNFLQEWKYSGKSNALYRGTKDSIGELQKFKTAVFRMPRDTTYTATLWLDNFYKQKLGVALRTTSVFATGDFDSANAYGPTFYCIPASNYTLYCNSKVRDVYTDVFAPYGTQPKFSKSQQIFSTYSIMISAKTNYRPDPKWGTILRQTASTFLTPTVAVFSDSDKIELLKRYKPWAYLNGKYIFEQLDEVNVPGDKISAEKAYEIFWKPCFDELLKRMESLFSETKKMSLTEASGTNNEVMIQCPAYYLATKEVISQIWE